MTNKTPTPEQLQKDTIAMFEAMAKTGGGPAAPMQIQYGVSDNGQPAVWFSIGLTKREQFAAMMMASLIANRDVSGNQSKWADAAVNYADVLLERLKK